MPNDSLSQGIFVGGVRLPPCLLEHHRLLVLLAVQHGYVHRRLGEFGLRVHLAFAVGEFEAHLRHRQAGGGPLAHGGAQRFGG